jgi:hypothetical protein
LEPCKSGGRWSFRVDKLTDVAIDQLWFELVLALTGGDLIESLPADVSANVLGLAYSGKPQAAKKISLWLGCRDAETTLLIGKRLFALVAAKEYTTGLVGEFAFNDFVSGDKYAFVLGEKAPRPPHHHQHHADKKEASADSTWVSADKKKSRH